MQLQCDAQQFRDVCSRFPTGVTVTTVWGNDNQPHGITVSSFTSISMDPPLVLVCIDQWSQMLRHLRINSCFAVNILGDHQKDLSVRFSTNGIDRFQGLGWYRGPTGTPLLNDTAGHFDCRVRDMIIVGDHIIVIGQVLYVSCGQRRPPLAYCERSYGSVTQTTHTK